MPIYELNLEKLGPFDKIHFEFDTQINVFVGPNNCGKSTALMALGDISVLGFAIPKKLIGNRKAKFSVYKGATAVKKDFSEGEFPIIQADEHSSGYWEEKKLYSWMRKLGELGYSSLIPALRWNTDYRAKGAMGKQDKEGYEIDMKHITHKKLYLSKKSKQLKNKLASRKLLADISKREALFETSASLVSDKALIQKMVDLDYKSYREKKPSIRKILEEIAIIASEITKGFPLKFLGIAEDSDGLYPEFETPDGKLPINVLSQGTQSLLQWLGILLIGYAEFYNYPKDLEKKRGIVIVDEIDAHLHPSWQRRILPAISQHFPKLQFFCSSHSPFVLAGLKAGQVQLLKRDHKGKVIVSRNENDIVGWSTDEISRNFLNIANPTDSYTNDNIEKLRKLRNKKKLSKTEKNKLENLRNTVRQNLISGAISSDMNQLVQIMQKASYGSKPHKKSKVLKKTKKS